LVKNNWIMRFIGKKTKNIYTEFISKYIQKNISIYVEPFGGSFAISTYLENKPDLMIYNDINTYDININADHIHHLDYKDIFDMYDSPDAVFYIDPPYFLKEFYYDGCENYTKDFHVELKEKINNLKGKVIISYESKSFILKLYSDYNIYRYNGTDPILKNEIIITNFVFQ
jgi:site-specific DNA-adenine methylase